MDRVARPSRRSRGDARAPLPDRARARPCRGSRDRRPGGARPASDCARPGTGPMHSVRMPRRRSSTRRRLELWPEDDPEPRRACFFRYAHRRQPAWSRHGSFDIVSEARDALLAAGDSGRRPRRRCSVAEVVLAPGSETTCVRATCGPKALVADEPTSYSKAYVVANVSRYLMLAGRASEAIRLGREALAMAEELGIDELRSHALNNIGIGRIRQGDRGGLEDLEQSSPSPSQPTHPRAFAPTATSRRP